jgi:hypothetical protein
VALPAHAKTSIPDPDPNPVTVRWTVSGTFNSGGTLSGTFDFTADTSAFSNINLVTSGTEGSGDGTYDAVEAGTSQATLFANAADIPTMSGDIALRLHNFGPRTDAGGVLPISLTNSQLSSCLGPLCNPSNTLDSIVGGTMTGVPL